MKSDFPTKFFQKQKVSERTVFKYFRNAVKDFQIASKNEEPEVIFKFSYDGLIKIGIALISADGYRIRSRVGHHIKILEKLSQILNNEDIAIIGNKMRKKRNLDLYDGGIIIGLREAKQYLDFIEKVIKKGEEHLKHQHSLL